MGWRSVINGKPFLNDMKFLNDLNKSLTDVAEQFFWGGNLLNCNGGSQRCSQRVQKPLVEGKTTWTLDCEKYTSSRNESWFSDLSIQMILVEIYRTSYRRDNRVISPASPYPRRSLPPRCRLKASSCWRWYEGLICSIINALRELGSERRKTVWPLCSLLYNLNWIMP